MSEYTQQISIISDSIKTAARRYTKSLPKDSDINWQAEKVFANDLMRGNKKLRGAIPETQVSAILQAGSMGLTLNPSEALCYLIPRATTRGGSTFIAYASPSYRGLIKTAVDSGAILYGVAEVVYQNDRFEFFGKTKPPIHVVDVKKPRGEAIGVYALARLPNGSEIPEWMSKQEVMAVKAKSDNPNGLMWNEFWTQGWCKAVLRRAQKTWPRSKQLNTAIEILNENEGIDFSAPESVSNADDPQVLLISKQQSLIIDAKITDNELNMEIFMTWLRRYYRGVHEIEDLAAEDFDAVVEKIDETIEHMKAAKDA